MLLGIAYGRTLGRDSVLAGGRADCRNGWAREGREAKTVADAAKTEAAKAKQEAAACVVRQDRV